MKLNNLCKDYINNVTACKFDRNTFLMIYKEFINNSNNNLMSYYFRNYAPYDENIINDKIHKLHLEICNNVEKYKNLIEYNFEQKYFNSFLDFTALPSELFKNICINVFLGIGTCHGFTMIENGKLSINIALEKFLNSKDAYKEIHCTIIHELTHVARILSGKYKNNRLGDILVEEGLACYFSKNILNLSEREEEFVFLNNIKSDQIDYYIKFSNIYLQNIYSDDIKIIMKLMHYGDQESGLIPGTGYNIGMKIICMYINTNDLKKREIINLDSDMVISSIINQEIKIC